MINLRSSILEDANSDLTALSDFEYGRILNFNKPAGWTSFDVVKKVRNVLKVKKVGHAGTLDPFATGVLLVCTGKATKRVNELICLEKEYLARVELGRETDTFDCTGTVVRQTDSLHLAPSAIINSCKKFEGEIYQTPPMFSAVKVNGVRLYNLARQGLTIARKARKINIYKLDVVDIKIPFVTLKVVCSKGTYIRTLAHDIGEKLACGANLNALTRTRIGSHTIEKSYAVSEFVAQHKTL